jgi:hypothetical protein
MTSLLRLLRRCPKDDVLLRRPTWECSSLGRSIRAAPGTICRGKNRWKNAIESLSILKEERFVGLQALLSSYTTGCAHPRERVLMRTSVILPMDDGLWNDMYAIVGAASEATCRDETHFSSTLGVCMQKMQHARDLITQVTTTKLSDSKIRNEPHLRVIETTMKQHRSRGPAHQSFL